MSDENAQGGAVVMAAERLIAVTRDDFLKWVGLEAWRAPVYAAARKMCEAAGFDPDTVVMGHPNMEPMLGPKRTIVFYAPIQPAWMLFWSDAQIAAEAIAAATAAKTGETVT